MFNAAYSEPRKCHYQNFRAHVTCHVRILCYDRMHINSLHAIDSSMLLFRCFDILQWSFVFCFSAATNAVVRRRPRSLNTSSHVSKLFVATGIIEGVPWALCLCDSGRCEFTQMYWRQFINKRVFNNVSIFNINQFVKILETVERKILVSEFTKQTFSTSCFFQSTASFSGTLYFPNFVSQ